MVLLPISPAPGARFLPAKASACYFFVLFFLVTIAGGQSPSVEIDPGEGSVTVPTESGKYYVVQGTDSLEDGFVGGEFFFGDGLSRVFDFDLVSEASDFLRITSADQSVPNDIDGDGIDDLFELQYSQILNMFDASDGFVDSDGDGRSNLWEYLMGFDPSVDDVLTTFSSSPFDGADDVAVTHETVLSFTRPLKWKPTQFDIKVEAAGQPLRTNLYTSSDLKTVTVFYPDGLPGSSQIRVTVNPSNLRDVNGNELDLDSDGLAGGVGVVEFSTLSLSALEGTSVVGRVFASEVGVDGSEKPISGVKVSVDGRENELFAITDEFGDFRLSPVPVGRFFVHINGKTAEGDIPVGAYYPLVGKAWESVAGAETYVGEIYLPLVAAGTLTPLSETETTVVEFPDSVLAANPDLMGVQAAGAAGGVGLAVGFGSR